MPDLSLHTDSFLAFTALPQVIYASGCSAQTLQECDDFNGGQHPHQRLPQHLLDTALEPQYTMYKLFLVQVCTASCTACGRFAGCLRERYCQVNVESLGVVAWYGALLTSTTLHGSMYGCNSVSMHDTGRYLVECTLVLPPALDSCAACS